MSTNNDFVSLAVPGVPGVGAASDISDMAFGLSLIVEGPGSSSGEIVIEASEDGVTFAPATAVFPINNPPAKLLKIVAKFARVVRFTGGGPAVVVLASAKTGLNLFGTLSLSPLDTSEMGPLKTVVVAGQYVGPIVIEGSGDGTNYDAVASFNTQDADVISIEGTWATMRVRPNTVLTGVTVALGSGFVPGAGGTGGAVTQIIAGTNVTISPPSGLGAVTINASGGGGSTDHLEESLILNDTALTKYLVVKMNGDSQFNVSRADIFGNCAGTIGVLTEDAPSVAPYKVATNGQQRVAMEAALTPGAGDTIWVSPVVFGRATNVKPTTPGQFVIRLGTIKDASAYLSDAYVTADLNIGELEPAGSGSGITAVNSGDSGIVTKTVGTVVTVSQQVGAEWQFGRVYAVDGDLGDDAHLGYADMTAATTGAYAVACAAAGAVAKKTLAGLQAIFPRVGNGRIAVVLIKQDTYADSIDFLQGVVGYANGCPLVRGTVTDATAGSVAFAGDSNDALMAGCKTVVGLNAAGYNPTGVPTTNTIPCVLNGGGAPGLPSDPSVPVGWRMRFSNSAPTQVALRNQCMQITSTSTNDTLHTEFDLPAAPVSTDVFFLEQAGVIVPSVNLNMPPSSRTGVQLVGIMATGLFDFFNGSLTTAMCGSGTGLSSFYSIFTTSHEYTDPFLGTINTGGGFLTDGARAIFIECMTFLDALVAPQGVQFFNPNGAMNFGRGCVGGGLEANGAMLSAGTRGALPPDIGTTGTLVGSTRLVGSGFLCDGVSLTIGDLSITQCPQSCLAPHGKNTLVFVGQVSGSSGNTQFGLDLSQCVHSDLIFLNTMPTVTGARGDLRFANSALGVWTNIQFEEAYDQAGNRLFLWESFGAEYNATLSPSVMAGVHVNPLGADAAYTLMRGSGASGQVTPAMADTLAHASGLVGKLLAAAEDGAACLYGGMTGYSLLVFDAAPVLDAIAYLSVSTPGLASTTIPPAVGTNQKLRLGIVIGNAFPGTLALVRMTPEILPVPADGAA